MWVEEREPVAGSHVLMDHRFEKCALSRAGFPDDVHVVTPISLPDPKRPPTVAEVRAAKKGHSVIRLRARHSSIVTGAGWPDKTHLLVRPAISPAFAPGAVPVR